MGLDQYAYCEDKFGDREEIAYWRQHNRLHGWMEELYHNNGGDEEFNCIDLELTWEDIYTLEDVIDEQSLPPTSGFFFGQDSYQTTRRKTVTTVRILNSWNEPEKS